MAAGRGWAGWQIVVVIVGVSAGPGVGEVWQLKRLVCADAIPFDTGYGATPGMGQVYTEGGDTGYLSKSSGQFDGQGSGHDFFGTVSLPHQPMFARKPHPSIKWSCSAAGANGGGLGWSGEGAASGAGRSSGWSMEETSTGAWCPRCGTRPVAARALLIQTVMWPAAK